MRRWVTTQVDHRILEAFVLCSDWTTILHEHRLRNLRRRFLLERIKLLALRDDPTACVVCYRRSRHPCLVFARRTRAATIFIRSIDRGIVDDVKLGIVVEDSARSRATGYRCTDCLG